MPSDETWPTRRASLHDLGALADVCRAAMGPDDYVLELLEDLVLRQVVFVALDDDAIVGMGAYRETPDDGAWVSAARTHPAYRRKGVAGALLHAFEGLARNKGRRALRLWSESSNGAGLATAHAAGLEEVTRFARRVAPAARRAVRPATAGLTDTGWGELERSSFLAKGRGFVGHASAFVRFTRPVAHLLANTGSLVRWDGCAALLSESPTSTSADVLEVSPLLGAPDQVLRDAAGLARARGAASVEVFLPHDRDLLRAADAAGLEPGSWGQEAVLCEKPLSVSTIVRRKRRTYAEINASKRSGYAALARLAPGGHTHGATGPHEDRWNR